MMHFNAITRVLPATLCVALMSGCGGGNTTDPLATAAVPTPRELAASAVVGFVSGLFADTSGNATPTDLSLLTVGVDDSAEPAPIP